jgi:hypothetical protein
MKKEKNYLWYVSIIFLTGILLNTCKTAKHITNPSEPVIFEVSPVPVHTIRQATPLGNLNPPGHTFPTDHIYFYLNGKDLVEVNAITDGIIQSTYYNAWSDDYRIEFKHTETFYSYLDHVKNLFSEISTGAQIKTGDPVGYGDPNISAVDLGVIDYDTTLYFVNPDRYHDKMLHCGDPYRYFTESVRNELLKKNPRIAEPRGGKIDFDMDGTISGNWFLEGTPVDESMNVTWWSHHLAFVYDIFEPSNIRICAGGTLNLAPFNYGVKGNTPDPGSVTLSTGIVKYELVSYPSSVLLVQMQDDRTIKVEVFPDKTLQEVTDFTDQASIYTR